MPDTSLRDEVYEKRPCIKNDESTIMECNMPKVI